MPVRAAGLRSGTGGGGGAPVQRAGARGSDRGSVIVTLVVGLTGNIASGKSSVARRLAALGATVIDADQLARQAVEAGSPALERIAERWAQRSSQRTVCWTARRSDAAVHDHDELEALNRIVHSGRDEPAQGAGEDCAGTGRACGHLRRAAALRASTRRRVRPDRAGRCAPPLRLERLVRDRNLDETEALDMITAQMPAELKRARADIVIDNTGTPDELDARVSEVWAALSREASAPAASVTA